MKLFTMIVAVGLWATCSMAGDRVTVLITVTNAPSALTGGVYSVNGDYRYWSNTTSSATLVQITNSTAQAATNLYQHALSCPFGTGKQYYIYTNSLKIVGASGVGISATITGDWGFVTSSSTASNTDHGLVLPLSNAPPANAMNDANLLVDALNIATKPISGSIAPGSGVSTNVPAVATFATSSGYATNAGSATFAMSTPYATNAGFSTSGGYSTNAGAATFATSSGYSTNAGYSAKAGHATNADFSATGNFATDATYAVSSGYATNAGAATFATSTSYATNAGSVNATGSLYSVSSGYATNAGYSASSGYATNSGSATGPTGPQGSNGVAGATGPAGMRRTKRA